MIEYVQQSTVALFLTVLDVNMFSDVFTPVVNISQTKYNQPSTSGSGIISITFNLFKGELSCMKRKDMFGYFLKRRNEACTRFNG